MKCDVCEFNFNGICAGHDLYDGKDIYGTSIKDTKKMFPDGCADYNDSLEEFSRKRNLRKQQRSQGQN